MAPTVHASRFQLYNQAVELDPSNGELYLKRSHAHSKLCNHKATVADVDAALERGSRSAKGFLRKGTAAFALGDFATAKESFERGAAVQGSGLPFGDWIEKCDAELEKEEAAAAGAAARASKIRHDWYQTDSHVVIDVLLKNQRPEDLQVKFTSNTVDVKARLPCGTPYELSLQLAHPVVPEETGYKCLGSKVEIRAKKREGIRWTTLEADERRASEPAAPMAPVPATTAAVKRGKDWDSICKKEDEGNEKEDGDAALNALFQKIYAEGSDEVKRAMNKSFLESGGTVLSTNWKEVSSKTTPVKPPDGTEYRRWK